MARYIVLAALAALLGGCVSPADPSPVVRQEFEFQILGLETPRQQGRTLDVFVRYRYPPELPTTGYPDYREIRSEVLEFLRVRPEEPADEYWEVLNRDLVRHLVATFPLEAATTAIEVRPDPNPKLEEPGWHGSIATIGEIEPLRFRGSAALRP